jgi:hypothetical protein
MSIIKLANEDRTKRLENGAIKGAAIGAATGAGGGYIMHRSIKEVHNKAHHEYQKSYDKFTKMKSDANKYLKKMSPLKRKFLSKIIKTEIPTEIKINMPKFPKMNISRAKLMTLGALSGISMGVGSGLLTASLKNKINDRLSKRKIDNV